MTYLTLLAGFVLLLGGGEILVRGAVALAQRLGISPLLVGLTVVGFGTSTPELVTSVQAALAEAPGLALGNVVGSNTANILLILALAALISPIAAAPHVFRRDGLALGIATAACIAVTLWGTIGRPVGALFVAGLASYIVAAYLLERNDTPADADPGTGATRAPILAAGLAVTGIAITILGANLLVGAAITLATRWGVSEAVIGLTVVAVGTSLPELVSSVLAALRRQTDLALGNIVGSNVYNILGILGVTALVRPMAVPPEIARFDIWIMLAATVALGLAAASRWRISRREGAALLAGYAAYIAVTSTAV